MAVMLDYPLHASGVRQRQVGELLELRKRNDLAAASHVICGDFNAGPDADEMRMLTGRSEPPVPGLVFYDAWEVGGDGGTGITWSNDNPLAAVGLMPDRRCGYILSAWPRRGGIGHPTARERLGVRPPAIYSCPITTGSWRIFAIDDPKGPTLFALLHLALEQRHRGTKDQPVQ